MSLCSVHILVTQPVFKGLVQIWMVTTYVYLEKCSFRSIITTLYFLLLLELFYNAALPLFLEKNIWILDQL